MERRQQQRRPIRQYATLSFNNRRFPCLLVDFSIGGALLALSSEEHFSIGSQIDLAMEYPKGLIKNVKAFIIRQQGDFIGIRYEQNQSIAEDAPSNAKNNCYALKS